MRILPALLLQFLPFLLYAQRCDTLGGIVMNCTDRDSLKQGYWYEYAVHKILTTDSFMKNPKAVGFHNDKGEVHTPIAEGYYKDNKKVGDWIYYVGFYNDPNAHIKTVTFTDSGFRHETDTFYHYVFKISDDTSALTGKLFLKNDTVDVVCNDGRCELYDPFRKKTKKLKRAELEGFIRYLNFRSYVVEGKP